MKPGFTLQARQAAARLPALVGYLRGNPGRWSFRGVDRRVLALVLGVFGLALTVGGVSGPAAWASITAHPLTTVEFLLMAALLQVVTIDVYGRSGLSFASTGLMAFGFALGAPAALWVGLLSGLVDLFFGRRPPLYRALYNMAQFGLASYSCVTVYAWTRDLPAPLPFLLLIVVGITYYVINSGSLAVAIGLEMGERPLKVWEDQLRWYWVYTPPAAILAYGLVFSNQRMGPLGLLLFALPPLAMMLSLRQYTTKTDKSVKEVWEVNRKLSESEEHFRSLIEDTADAVTVVDGQGRVNYASPPFERLLGLPREELLGQPVLDLIGKGQRRAALNGLRQHFATPDVPFELLFERDDQARRLEVLARKKEGELVLTIRDITARKEAEAKEKQLTEQLQQSQKMEAIGQLAGGVAHDFNNLLMVIMGCSELLLMQMDEDDTRRAEAEEIARTSARAAALTRQLLAFSRKQVLEPQPLDLNASVSNLQKMLERIIGTDVRLTTRFEEELAPIHADPGQVEQVLMNLVVNARDAMEGLREERPDHKATIDVTVRAADPERLPAELEPGDYLVMAVRDNGSGMSEETKAKIFEPFFTTKEVGKGTGLGLATVYGIVQQSGGAIGLDSEIGKGTTFNIYFPRYDGAVDLIDSEDDLQAIAGEGTVLVVDDEDGVRRYAATVLEERGYRVLTARSGLDALDLARRLDAPIDLLLTDIVMPEMTGAALRVHMRADRPEIKVIYMSGHIGAVEFDDADDETPLINKPFTSTALLKAVTEALAASSSEPATL